MTSFSLILAFVLTLGAALLHFACICGGPAWYRLLGAGEGAVKAVEAGDRRPHVSAAVVGCVLLIWAAYALAGAGVIAELPFTRLVLFAVAALLLARAAAFPWLKPYFPGNTPRFWVVSSSLVGLLGVLFLLGAIGAA